MSVSPAPGPADTLQRCVGDRDRFASEVWGRHSQVHASGVPATDLLSLEDVDALVTSSALRIPTFRLVRDGRPLPASEYTRDGTIGGRRYDGVAAPDKVLRAMDDGATLVLQGAHRYHPPLSLLCRNLEIALGHRCQVNAYVTPPGGRGLQVHEDPHDVLVLQAFGTKTWEVHPTPWERENVADAAPVEQVLSPGDVQYLPKGTPHAARSERALSGHVTVGVLGTTWGQVLTDTVTALVADDRTVPAGWPDDPKALAAGLADRLELLAGQLRGVDAEAVVASRVKSFLTSRPPLLAGALADRQRLDLLDDASPLVRRPGAVCRVVDGPTPHTVSLLLGDRRVDVPAWVRPAAEVIAVSQSLTPSDLADHLDDVSRVVLCRRLVREGLLTTACP